MIAFSLLLVKTHGQDFESIRVFRARDDRIEVLPGKEPIQPARSGDSDLGNVFLIEQ